MLQKARKKRSNSSNYNNIKCNIDGKNEHKKNNRGTMVMFYVIFLIITGMLLITYIGQSVKITYLNYDIENMEQKLNQIKETNQQLNLKIAKNTSLARVEKLARKRLNMIEPEQTEVVVLHNHNEKQTGQQKVHSGANNQIYFLQLFSDIWQNFNTVMADSPE